MIYNEKLAARIREFFGDIDNVEEKRMFRGITFMVNGKMCVSASVEELMCRLDPSHYEAYLEKTGCRPMIHQGRIMKGFVFISEAAIQTRSQLNYWLQLALEYNSRAPASKKK